MNEFDVPSLDDPSMSMMQFGIQWFGKDVGELFLGWNPVDRHDTLMFFHELVEMPIFDVDVLGSRTNAILLSNGNGSLVIFMDFAENSEPLMLRSNAEYLVMSLITWRRKMASRVAADRATISASVDESVTSVWSLLPQTNDTPAYMIR